MSAQPQRPTTTEALQWQMHALCRQVSPELFFSEGNARHDFDAIRICRVCPVRQQCLDYALTYGELGIWGGTTEKQRREMRRKLLMSQVPFAGPSNNTTEWLELFNELKSLGYNDVQAARRMGISTQSLCRQLSRYGLTPDAVAQEELTDLKRQKRQGVA